MLQLIADFRNVASDPCLYVLVDVKSMSLVNIELLFIILYNTTALHHNTNVFSMEIKYSTAKK